MHCLMHLDVSFISSTVSSTSSASSPSLKVNSQIHLNHPPTPTICAHMLRLSAYHYKWTISTLIPGETPTCVQNWIPTVLLKNVEFSHLFFLNEPTLHSHQHTNMLRLSQVSIHLLFFQQLPSYSFTPYCSTSQKMCLSYCHWFLFPIFL